MRRAHRLPIIASPNVHGREETDSRNFACCRSRHRSRAAWRTVQFDLCRSMILSKPRFHRME